MKKKLIIAAVAVYLVFTIFPHGIPLHLADPGTPEEVTKEFFNAVKAQDSDTLKRIVLLDGSESGLDICNYVYDNAEYFGPLDKDIPQVKDFLENDLYPKLLAFDYKIKDVKTEDDVSLDYSDSYGKKAIVTVEIKSYNLGAAVYNAFADFGSQGGIDMLGNEGYDPESKNHDLDVQLDALLIPCLKNRLSSLKKTHKETLSLQFELPKGETQWQLPLNQESICESEGLLDQLTAGAYTTFAYFEDGAYENFN